MFGVDIPIMPVNASLFAYNMLDEDSAEEDDCKLDGASKLSCGKLMSYGLNLELCPGKTRGCKLA